MRLICNFCTISSSFSVFSSQYILLIGNFRELIEYLNGTSDLLAKNGNILDNVLETVDVQQHSLGVLYVLVAKLTNLSVSLRQIFLSNYYCIMLRAYVIIFLLHRIQPLMVKMSSNWFVNLSRAVTVNRCGMLHKLVSNP